MRLLMTPLTLLGLCAILVFGTWWGYKQITAPLPGDMPTPCVPTSATELAAKQVVVRVLNGGYKTGLGAKVGKEMETFGFTVGGTGNTQERIKKTVIVASAENAPEAELVKGFFKDATVRASEDRKIDGIVEVLVGSEYSGTNPEAPKTIAVSGEVCLAVPPAPTPSAGATPVR